MRETFAKKMFIGLTVAALSLGTVGAFPAAAQQSGKVKSTHGAWSIVCDTPAGAQTFRFEDLEAL